MNDNNLAHPPGVNGMKKGNGRTRRLDGPGVIRVYTVYADDW